MKFNTEKKSSFQPFSIEITFENEEELTWVYAVMNHAAVSPNERFEDEVGEPFRDAVNQEYGIPDYSGAFDHLDKSIKRCK